MFSRSQVFVGAFKAATTQKVWQRDENVSHIYCQMLNKSGESKRSWASREVPNGYSRLPAWIMCNAQQTRRVFSVSDDLSSTWPFWRWAEHVQSSAHILLRRPAAGFRRFQYQEWTSQIEVHDSPQTRRLDRIENCFHYFHAFFCKCWYNWRNPSSIFKLYQIHSQSIEPSSRVSWLSIDRSSSVFDRSLVVICWWIHSENSSGEPGEPCVQLVSDASGH